MLRSRLEAETALSFAATARQTDRAVRLLAGRFDANSNQAYLLPVMREVSGHYDSADFGLGSVEDDASALAEVHERLVSTDWSLLRTSGGRDHPAVLAVADADARLVYTSAAPDVWQTDLGALPPLRRAREGGRDSSMTLLRYDEPALVTSRLLGPSTAAGVAVVFTRTLRVGGTPRSQLLQIVSARQLLDDIRLDDETRLALVTLDGSADGDVPVEVVAGAISGKRAPTGFQTAQRLLRDPLGDDGQAGGEPIGYLVMARSQPALLALFPHARGVFATAMLLALAGAIAAALRVRQVTRARV